MERMDKMEDAERKLELTRYLRQEQNLNRMKVKNREDILYGTGKNSEMLYGDDGLELAEYDRIREQGHMGPMFGLPLPVNLIFIQIDNARKQYQADCQPQPKHRPLMPLLPDSVIFCQFQNPFRILVL